MNAKDTVMNPQRRAAVIHMINAKSLGSEHRVAKNIAEAQAEISFKAGQEEGRKDVVSWFNKRYTTIYDNWIEHHRLSKDEDW